MMKTSSKTAEVEVRSVIDEWAKAMRVKDVAGVAAHLAQNFVQFDLAPPLRMIGPDRQGLANWFSTWQGLIGFEIKDLHVTAGDGVAFCYSLIHLTGSRTDGSETNVWLRSTVCLRRINNTWKIAHGHESVPMYMDGSHRAAIDLEP